MRYILAFLLCYSITITKGNENNNLFKRIVTGGNKNATLGQVIAGYKKIDGSIPNYAHIGIRTPRLFNTSVYEEVIDQLGVTIYPNPSNQDNVFYMMNDIKNVVITDMYGKIVENSVDLQSQKITLPYRGVFFIKFTTESNKIYSSRVIYN